MKLEWKKPMITKLNIKATENGFSQGTGDFLYNQNGRLIGEKAYQ